MEIRSLHLYEVSLLHTGKLAIFKSAKTNTYERYSYELILFYALKFLIHSKHRVCDQRHKSSGDTLS